MLPKKNMIVMVAFLLPVLCCLIGVGAFVLATTAVSDPNQPPISPASDEDLRAQLAKLDEEIAALRSQLGKEDERDTLARRVRDLMDKLEADTTGVAEGLSELVREIARIQASLQQIVSSRDGLRELGEPQAVSGSGGGSGATPPVIPLPRTTLRSGHSM